MIADEENVVQSFEGEIVVKTAEPKKRQKKQTLEKKEYKKGKKQVENGKVRPKEKVSRVRLMVTFEHELGFQSLLEDYEELQKLKKTSYLDSGFLEEEKKYRVHLYYKDNLRRRIIDLEKKYPVVKKTVELDVLEIRLNVDLTNPLSRAIDAIEKFGIPQIILPLRAPGAEEFPVKKKIKTSSSNDTVTVIPTHKKTKADLVIENTNLKLNLRTSLMRQSNQGVVISSLQKKVQQLLAWQGLVECWVEQVMQTLSPTKKSQLEQILAAAAPKTELFPESRDFEEIKHEKEDKPEIEQLISSNKDEVFFRKRRNTQDNEKNTSSNQDKVLEDMFFTFSDHGNSENSKKPTVLQKCENNQELLEQSHGEDNTSSSFINSSDEGKHREKPVQTTIVEQKPKSHVIKANPSVSRSGQPETFGLATLHNNETDELSKLQEKTVNQNSCKIRKMPKETPHIEKTVRDIKEHCEKKKMTIVEYYGKKGVGKVEWKDFIKSHRNLFGLSARKYNKFFI